MTELEKVKVKDLMTSLEGALKDLISDPLSHVDGRKRFKDFAESTLESALNHFTTDFKYDCWLPTGYILVRTKHKAIVYFVETSSGKKHKSSSFSGNRLARVYGKRNWKSLLISDIEYKPITPLDYITLNFVVPSKEESFNGALQVEGSTV